MNDFPNLIYHQSPSNPEKFYITTAFPKIYVGETENETYAKLFSIAPSLHDLAENLLIVLKYPRGSEAQIRCLEEVAQDARAIIAKVKGAQE